MKLLIFIKISILIFIGLNSITFNCADSASNVNDELKLASGKPTNICLHVLPFGVKSVF